VKNRPFMSNSDMKTIVKQHENQIGTITLQMAQKRTHKNAKATTARNKVFGDDAYRSKAQKGTLEFFWNYNTVEASLLFCASLVLLAGLMFQDQTAIQPGSMREEGLFWITMLIILGSIFYFFIVLLSEIGVGLGYKQCQLVKWNKKKLTVGAHDHDGPREIEDSISMVSSPLANSNPLHSQQAEEEREMKNQLDNSADTIAKMQEEMRNLKKKAAMASHTSSDTVLKQSSFRDRKQKKGKKKSASKKKFDDGHGFSDDEGEDEGDKSGRGWSVYSQGEEGGLKGSNPMAHHGEVTKSGSFRDEEKELAM